MKAIILGLAIVALFATQVAKAGPLACGGLNNENRNSPVGSYTKTSPGTKTNETRN